MFYYVAANWLQILLSVGVACYALIFVWTTHRWEVKYQKQRHRDAVKYDQQRHQYAHQAGLGVFAGQVSGVSAPLVKPLGSPQTRGS
jgi:hypothetical protein